MTKVPRVVLADGAVHEIACAILADGVTSPAKDLLELLDKQVWPDPQAERLPDEYQATIRRRFLAQVQHLAEYGELESEYNRLRDGIWEFKISNLRVTFYDTPGDGTFTAKNGSVEFRWDGRPLLPDDFDVFLRVGHYFAKDTQKTRESDIKRSLTVRKEDLSHDCNN